MSLAENDGGHGETCSAAAAGGLIVTDNSVKAASWDLFQFLLQISFFSRVKRSSLFVT